MLQVRLVRWVGLVMLPAPAALLLLGAAPPVAVPPWQRLLKGEAAKQAEMLQTRMVRAWDSGDFEAARKAAQSVAALRTKEQGADHWQTVEARCLVERFERALKAGREDQEAFANSRVLLKQAYAETNRRRLSEAQVLLEKVLAIHRKVLGEDHPDTAAGYNNLAYNLNARKKYAEAQPLYEKALASFRKALGEEHPHTAMGIHNLATNLNEQGKYASAQPLFEQSLAIRCKVLGDEHPLSAFTRNTVAHNLHALGRDAEGQPLLEKALASNRKVFGEEHPETARSYNNLAANLSAQGKYAQAQSLDEKALAIFRKVYGDDHPLTAGSYNNLAANLKAQGKYALAQPLDEKALAIRRKALGENHPGTAQSYNNVAVNLRAQGKDAQAQALYEKALAIRRKVLGEDHPDTAQSYNNVAANLSDQGKRAEAEPLFEKALAIRRKVLGEDHPDTAQSYNNVGANLNAQGKYIEAQPWLEKALKIRRKVLGEDHPDTAGSYNNVGSNLSYQGKWVQAHLLLEKALAMHRKILGENHPLTSGSYSSVAANLHDQGDHAGAEKYRTLAADSFVRARLRIALPGLDRAAFTDQQSPLVYLASVLARNGKPRLAWQRFAQSLAQGTSEEQTARLRRTADEQARLAVLRNRLDRLDRLIRTTLAPGEETPQRSKEREDLLTQRVQAGDDLDSFRRDLEKRHGVLAGQVHDLATVQKALPPDSAFLAWIDISALPSAKDPSGEHWAVLVRSTGDPLWTRLAGSGPGGSWTKDDRRLPDRLGEALESAAGAWREPAQRLRRQRLEPLAEHLEGIKHLIVLPSPWLDGLPIEVLAEGRTVSYVPSPSYFVRLAELPRPRTTDLLAVADPTFERGSASSKALPPGGLLIRLVVPGSNADKARLRPGDVLLKYGDQELTDSEQLGKLSAGAGKEGTISLTVWRDGKAGVRTVPPGPLGVVPDKRPAREALEEERRNDRLMSAVRGEEEEWLALPGTRIEAEALRRLLGEKKVTLLADSSASQQRLDELAHSGRLKSFRYLHFATHGSADARLPLQSALVLARDALPDPLTQLQAGKPVYDGRLTAEEVVRNWNLDCDLVTLSACQTALGKYDRNEGFLGFAHAFLLAGSRSVVVSLWKVDDTATALFMDRFYRNLLGQREGLEAPLSKAEALAEARTWLRNLSQKEALQRGADLLRGVERGKGRPKLPTAMEVPKPPKGGKEGEKPFAHPYYWAAFVLVGDPR
jgi:tetratricopeptide (TPR) repeat protein